MANQNSGEEVFRPYARLITILGDQLITNKIVAINEIVKNSYDADAEKVTVRFLNIENQGRKNLTDDKMPTIEIEDDGDGMTIDIIRNVWLRPATPNKFNIKKGDKRFTKKKRLMQGEKGIGRFAVHKLGDFINIYTKVSNGIEAQLTLDLAEYDKGPQLSLYEDQSEIDKNYKFLDQIKNKWNVNSSPRRIKKEKGTVIQIKNLRDKWTANDIEQLDKSFKNLVSPIIPKEDMKELELKSEIVTDFDIEIEWQARRYKNSLENVTFESICKEAPFKFIGQINEGGILNYHYVSTLENQRQKDDELNLLDNEKAIRFYSINKRFFYFNKKTKEKVQTHSPNVGSFRFILYGFDLNDKAKWKNKKDELEFIKDNSVFLFRDGIRVYPYGNKEIDWLELGKMRAEYKAGDFFSYNDLMGFVFISHDDNPKLKDATNREGLMDVEGAYADFKALLIASIQVMKYESDIDKGKKEQKNVSPLQELKRTVANDFRNFSKKVLELNDKKSQELATKYLDSTKMYTRELERRTDIYEDLAGLGLAVEKASHDSLSLIEKMNSNLKAIRDRLAHNQEIPKDELFQIISDLHDNTYFLYEQLQLLQPLFRAAKRSETSVSIQDVANKVTRYFRLELESYKIEVEIVCKKDILVKTSVGLIMQILINLMDNSVYWLKEKSSKQNNKIIIQIDGVNSELTFADNGIGIDPEIAPLVFMEFYTTKEKERGRGLGLFIIKEIIDRLDGRIEIISDTKQKILPGANVKISFPKI